MERKFYLKWYKLYFNDIFVSESVFSNKVTYCYGIPNEELRLYRTFKNFNDFYFDYGGYFGGYKNCDFRKIVKVGKTVIKKDDIKVKVMVYDKPCSEEEQKCMIANHSCDYWLKELNLEQFNNLCKDYGFTSINLK